MELQTRTVRGINMRWHERGAGQPVVFLHGIPTGPRLWRRVLPLVVAPAGETVRALVWELVGYGDSIPEGRGRDISVARQADYLVDWLDALGIGRAVLVGHDLGGGVAQIAAVRHTARVAGLVLANTISYDSWPISEVRAMRAGGWVVERLPDQLVRPALALLFLRGHDHPARAREALALHWQPYRRTDGPAALIRQMRSLRTRDTQEIADRLPHLGVPAQLVWGAADPFQKIGYGYRLAHDLRAPLDRIEGGRHFVPEDHPERLAAAVRRVLDQGGATSAEQRAA